MDAKNNSWFLVFFILMYFSLNSHYSFAADTISGNQSLSGDKKIVSPGGDFVLGFFQPGNASKYYIGIWYGKVSTQTVVWVANRDKPVSDINSAELRISDGNLVLFDDSKSRIWSTSVNYTSLSQVEAAILDNGNLVLRDGSNSRELLWQSFDHPTHTWLPGGKLGMNKRTGENQRLVSWINEQDPAPGRFNLELDANGTSQYYLMWNRSYDHIYWTSGTWNGHIFSGVPEMEGNLTEVVDIVSNENESYFTYSVNDNPKTVISRFVMDVSGRFQQQSWLENSKAWNLFWATPRQQCEVYSFCGVFGSCNDNSQVPCTCLTGFEPNSQTDWDLKAYSGGCKRKTSLQCGNTSVANGKSDKFLVIPNVQLNQDPQNKDVGSSKECESTCLSDCSCTAYAYDSNGCSIWIGGVSVTQLAGDSSNGMTLNIRLAASESKSSSNNRGMLIGVIVGSVGAVVFLVILAIIYTRHRMRRAIKVKAVDGLLLAFGYKDLQNVTKNFSEKLGGGGFGLVFKGVLPDSSVIAVKKLESINQGEKQFRSEVSTIGKIQHVNLVRLRGFCSEGSRKLLVYDYMPNGSLDSHLFNENNTKILDWKTRYQIALGTARGLTYLHEKCRDCIIHCDIKPENILLDAELCPKVADFGLAKLVGREFSRVLTTMRGTRGYLAPEWISGVAITAKADVYSYGMMVLELVSGKRNVAGSEGGKVKFFPTWAASQIIQGRDVIGLLDPRLEEKADVEELTRVCKVACWCIQDNETFRPSMGQVVQILEGVVDVNMPPIPRSLEMFVDNEEHIIFFTESSSGQSSLTQSSTSTASSLTKGTISSTSSTSQLDQ